MEEALDPEDLEVGTDTSVLIDLAEGKVFQGLHELFPAVGLPGMVKQELERRTSRLNTMVLAADWLVPIRAEEPEDLGFIADLHRSLGGPPKNAGEAELIALARRHDWVALIEDNARRVAIREGVHVIRLSTLAAAAAACEVVPVDRAWGLHRGFHMRRPPQRMPAIGTTPADRDRFDRAVDAIGVLAGHRGRPAWPGLLRHPTLKPGQLDELVRQIGERP
ncbi:MAG: hypothetical protein AB7V42_07210 [Thermoleophilia bacterium]